MLTTSADPHGPQVPREVLGAQVRWGAVPPAPSDAVRIPRPDGAAMWATPDSVWFEDDVVRLLVQGDEEMAIEPKRGGSPAQVAHYAYGFGAFVVLLHRGRFALHASAVATDHGVVVVGGDAGAGKSLTCMTLAERGARFLVDDVTPLRVAPDRVDVVPFERPVHLMVGDLTRIGADALAPVVGRRTGDGARKAVVCLDAPVHQALPVALIAVLEIEPGIGPTPTVEIVAGAERMRWVVRLSNANGVASFADRRVPYVAWAAAVADRVPLIVVRRDPDADCVDGVVAAIEAHLGRCLLRSGAAGAVGE